MILLFISHSSDDKPLADALVELLTKALHLRSDQVRYTSGDGYRLKGGADFTNKLRNEVREAKAFVALISRASLKSTFVLFELGARWLTQRHLIPLVTPEIIESELDFPLSSLTPIYCRSESELFRLVEELAEELGVKAQPSSAYAEAVNKVIVECGKSIGQPTDHQHFEPSIVGTWVGWTRSMEGKYSLMIEQYSKGGTGFSVHGISYKPEFKWKAEWKSTSASFNSVDGRLYVSYETTIKRSTGEEIKTAGLGRLRVHGDEITGTVFDHPEKILIDGEERWKPMFFDYRLVIVEGREIPPFEFEAVHDTEEYRKIRNELSNLSEEWVAT